MKRDNWQTYVEIGGFAAIVVSLVLLIYEIRQNTLAVQTNAMQQHLEQHASFVLEALQNENLRDIDTRGTRGGLDVLAEDELGQFVIYNWNLLRNHFVAFELMQTGVLPQSQWLTFEAALERRVSRNKGFRDLWKARREEISEEFRSLVDSMVEQADSG